MNQADWKKRFAIDKHYFKCPRYKDAAFHRDLIESLQAEL